MEVMTVDQETGEVILTSEEQQELESKENESPKDYLTRIGDVIASKLQRARRYRLQAEKLAIPHEKTANWLVATINPLLKQYAPDVLPKYQSGENVGHYKSKTLNLSTISFSFTKDGGNYIANEERAIQFCKAMKSFYPSLANFVETKTILRKAELLSYLEKEGFMSKEDLKQDIMAFVSVVPVDEFAKVKVNI